MAHNSATILIVDSEPNDIFLLKKLLQPLKAKIIDAKTPAETMQQLGKHSVAVVLLDLHLGDMTGIDTLKSIRSRSLTKNVPVIFLTGKEIDDHLVIEGYEAGAVDYLYKPVNERILLSKCQVFIDLYHLRQKANETVLELGNYTAKLERANHRLQKEIEEHEKTVAEKKKVESILLEGQKLQAVGTLAGGIAHDFNNILYAILGYCDLIMRTEDVSKIKKYMEQIKTASERGASLVESVLSFSRQKDVKFTAISLQQVIEETIHLLLPTIPASVYLDKKYLTTPEYVWGDPVGIEQVIMNIINNSVDAIGEENAGIVTLTVDIAPDNADFYIENPNLKEGIGYYLIQIGDNGCGMSDEVKQRIFEPFFTTKDVNAGTGLGLASAYGIVQDHLGDIRVQSKLGEGTRFSIYLPIYKGVVDDV